MLTYKDYVMAESLEEAYELRQKKNNVLIGGNGWLKMQNGVYQTAIDLSALGLDTIKEDEEKFVIGCMATLRDLEKNEGLNAYTNKAAAESVRHIVGVQFRNCATVGGSIFGRFGFSDVLTLFLAMDTEVELYKGGIVPLTEFVKMPYDRDILVNLIVHKGKEAIVYEAFRNQATDFPVVTCCASFDGKKMRTVIGARPEKASLITDETGILSNILSTSQEEQKDRLKAYGVWAANQFTYGSNMRAGKEYRESLAAVLAERTAKKAVLEVEKWN